MRHGMYKRSTPGQGAIRQWTQELNARHKGTRDLGREGQTGRRRRPWASHIFSVLSSVLLTVEVGTPADRCYSHPESALPGGIDLPRLTLVVQIPWTCCSAPLWLSRHCQGFPNPAATSWIPERGSTLPSPQASGILNLRMQIRGCWPPPPHLPSSFLLPASARGLLCGEKQGGD